MKEVMNISQVCDINLGDINWQSVQDVINTLSGDGKTSLLQDVENKRKTEIKNKRRKLCGIFKFLE